MPKLHEAIWSCVRRALLAAAAWVIQPVLLVHLGCVDHQGGGIWYCRSRRCRTCVKWGHSLKKCRALAAAAPHQRQRDRASLIGSVSGRQWRRVVLRIAPPRQMDRARRS
jgi:hypothetical protein